MATIGVISDTHGLLRPEAVSALEGSDVILHAGDVGDRSIVDRLSRIAPVHAVFGNTDRPPLSDTLPHHDIVDLSEAGDATLLLYLVHELDHLDLDPEAAGIHVVVYGHTHKPDIDRRDGVLYFNPGAAGHRRFRLPVTVGRLTVGAEGDVRAEILHLDVDGS